MTARRFVERAGAAGRRPPVLFVAWSAVGGRSAEVAGALGGASVAVFPLTGPRRLPVAVRYLVASAVTLGVLVRRVPRALIVTNPPIVLGLLALGWCRLWRIPLALDSHPGSFGRLGDDVSARLLPVHRFVARRATVCLVTCDELGAIVRDWGGRALVLHEVPGTWTLSPFERDDARRPLVVFVTRYAPDEPVAAALGAAALAPEVDLAVTGRREDLPSGAGAPSAANLRFVGFLDPARYRALVDDADVVLSLTLDPTSVMRSAYEAVYAGKPLVVSDFPVDRALFPDAVAVENDPASIAAGITEAVARRAALVALAPGARRRQVARVEGQLAELRHALGLGPLPQGEGEPASEPGAQR